MMRTWTSSPPSTAPSAYLPSRKRSLPVLPGTSLISDLEQLHLPSPPPPPLLQVSTVRIVCPASALVTGQTRKRHFPLLQKSLPPFPEREASTGPVSPRELAVEAMKRQYHAQCFTCRTCRRQLAGQRFYQKDGAPLRRTLLQDQAGLERTKIHLPLPLQVLGLEGYLERCGKCGEVVQEHVILPWARPLHSTPASLSVALCPLHQRRELALRQSESQVYCEADFYRKFAPVCSICENPIIPRDGKDAFKIECMGRNFHENCYRCEDCSVLLSVEPTDQGCYPLNDHLFCKPCHTKRSAAGCC
ncbi:Filamin-binding LIM protein 1 [Apodemus speciosus]|uniref:Filamin-binding LIM protein 1 n=1 Tax=Apodemus speciosus TaxID=105296 RepID=A0ABQ0EQ48_APOSI